MSIQENNRDITEQYENAVDEIELTNHIFFDACDMYEHLKTFNQPIEDNDSVECSMCFATHSSKQMFIEKLEHIKENALALENRIKIRG